jgi:hypothetical protein
LHTGWPSRSTSAVRATCCASFCAAWPARYSCAKSSSTESATITPMIDALAVSPVRAETALAASRISTSGLRKRASNCPSMAWGRDLSWLGP